MITKMPQLTGTGSLAEPLGMNVLRPIGDSGDDNVEGCGSAELGEKPCDATLKGINSAGPPNFILHHWILKLTERIDVLERDMKAIKAMIANIATVAERRGIK